VGIVRGAEVVADPAGQLSQQPRISSPVSGSRRASSPQ
jgi:hypothetical protein